MGTPSGRLTKTFYRRIVTIALPFTLAFSPSPFSPPAFIIKLSIGELRLFFRRGTALALALLFMPFCAEAANNGAKPVPTVASAWALYTQRKFVESADAFEVLLKTNPASGRLYYHAAVANFAANRKARGNQLCGYVISNFIGSPEAQHCRTLMSSNAPPSSATPATSAPAAGHGEGELTEQNLPASFYASLPPDVRAQLKTPAGKQRLRLAIIDYNKRMAEQKSTEAAKKKSVKAKPTSASDDEDEDDDDDFAVTKFSIDKTAKRNEYPFTAAMIAKDGANGIDQSVNPNCWFEASMAALAELPRGQRLLASMIKYSGDGAYIVRFPGDGQEYKITEATMKEHGITDRALWAALLETAQVMKFPDNRGAEGDTGDQSRLAVGLGCITGTKAQLLHPHNSELQELSSFIGGAISSKNPIVCSTWHDYYLASLPELVVGRHAYTIIGFDPASNMVTIRNPHGKGSEKFYSEDTAKFQMKENGVFKMHLTLFQKYFYQVCRSFI